MSDRLGGKVALVTGAGSGIGQAICVRFAEEGAVVIATTRDPDHLKRTLDHVGQVAASEPLGLEMDVTDGGSVATAVAEAVARFGRIDILCANAGIDLTRSPTIGDVTDDEWNSIMAVNVTGAFFVTRAAVPHIPDGGAVVTVGSINSFVGWPDNVPYTTSKGAVLQFTRAIALDLAPRRIRANCVCPGVIDTPMTRAFIDAAPDAGEVIRGYNAVAPLGRMGTAAEVANATLFLASDEASFITGAALLVDGGTTAIV